MLYIDNRQEKIEITEELTDTLTKVIDYALDQEEVKIQCEVSMILIDNLEIRELNKNNRNVDKETDVLSFPMLFYPEGKVFKDIYYENKFSDSDLCDGVLVLGDIALSIEKALEQSEEFGHSFIRECAYLTVHSVLHLLGYDHMVESDKVKMRKREEEILLNFSIKR